MEVWLKTCLLLCSYGFFKEVRPSEPFLTEYLLGPYHNLTESQVYYDVYPVWTYCYLSLLVVVFLVTDLLRYKPVIVFEGIGYVATWSLLLWAGGVHWMQLMEFFYGVATSTEIAYFTYIYAQVDGKYYQKVTSYTRSALLTGRFLSGLLSQVLYSTELMDIHSLNYVSLASVSIAFCIALVLPSVKTSIYFHREVLAEASTDSTERKEQTESSVNEVSHHVEFYAKDKGHVFTSENFKHVLSLLWCDFKEAYTNRYLLKWSIWWSFATCVNFQVSNYIQPLWESIAPFQETDNLFNGAVEATSTLFGALAALAVGYLHVNWMLIGELTLAVISLLDALLLLFMGLTSNIWVGYINYIVFRVSYQAVITVARIVTFFYLMDPFKPSIHLPFSASPVLKQSYQVAKEMKADSYGLVFGINMFLALLIQTILTVIVVEWLEIEPGTQFVIYGCYFGLLSFLFFVISSYGLGMLGIQGIRRQGL